MSYGKSNLLEIPVAVSGRVLYATARGNYSANLDKRFCRFNLSNNNIEESDDCETWSIVKEQKMEETGFEKNGTNKIILNEWDIL